MAYTLRLNASQDKKLKKVITLLGVSTVNKAVIELVERFADDQKTIASLTKKCDEQGTRLASIQGLFQERDSLNKEIEKLILKG